METPNTGDAARDTPLETTAAPATDLGASGDVRLGDPLAPAAEPTEEETEREFAGLDRKVRREFFTASALTGLLARGNGAASPEEAAKNAVAYADAAIAALDATTT